MIKRLKVEILGEVLILEFLYTECIICIKNKGIEYYFISKITKDSICDIFDRFKGKFSFENILSSLESCQYIIKLEKDIIDLDEI